MRHVMVAIAWLGIKLVNAGTCLMAFSYGGKVVCHITLPEDEETVSG